jgi:hypothetical protein
MGMRIGVAGGAVAAALALGLVSACGGGSGPPGIQGECTGSIRFQNAVYIADSRLDQSAPRGPNIGPADVVDCDLETVVDQVVVSEVKGVDSRVAIRVTGRWRGLYVAKALARDQWPRVLR